MTIESLIGSAIKCCLKMDVNCINIASTAIITIIMVIFKCYFSGEHIALLI